MSQLEIFWGNLQNVFGSFRVQDIIDILLVAFVIYSAIKLMRDTRAGQLVKGILIILVIWVVANLLQLYMMKTLLTYIIQYGLVCLFVVFQPEMRSALEKMGRGYMGGIKSLMVSRSTADQERQAQWRRGIHAVVAACDSMSKSKTGALI
ncbi:MAG: TIGR00159 family protein, partial [Oscillospiraceae bacterium]|nr:TIGR00159 family protein [Oscillospiraceae bacterium]